MGEISDYILRGNIGIPFAGNCIPILLYIDAIVITADLSDCLRRHIDIIHSFEQDSGLLVKLGKQ